MIGVGSKVKLNVGGPEMSVVRIASDAPIAFCMWFGYPDQAFAIGERVLERRFPLACLVEVDPPRTATDEIDDDWISDQVSHALREAEDEARVTAMDLRDANRWIVRTAETKAKAFVVERYPGVPDDELTMAVLWEMAEQLLEDNAHLLRQAADGAAQAQSALHGGDLG